MENHYIHIVCCMGALVTAGILATSDLDFDRQVYHHQVSSENVQESMHVFSVQLTRQLFTNETIQYSRILGDNSSRQFVFNASTLSVHNSNALSPGRYDFSIVMIIHDCNLMTAAVVDVLSQYGSACMDQSFGQCSQNCRERSDFVFGYECFCEEGYILQEDMFTCLVTEPYPELLFTTSHTISSVNLINYEVQEILNITGTIKAFDYDYKLKVLYYVAENQTGSLISGISISKSSSFLSELYFTDTVITDIAVDWMTSDIYYIDNVTASINVWKNSTAKKIMNSLENPRNLIFSSVSRNIYWINGLCHNASILSQSLNGTDLMTTVISNICPLDISLDPVDDDIFYIDEDGNLFSISSGNTKNVATVNGVPRALEVFEVFAYVALQSGTIIKLNVRTKAHERIMLDVTDMTIFHPLKQSFSVDVEDCNFCQETCAINSGHIKCVCDEGFIVGADGYSCISSEALGFTFSSYSTETNKTRLLSRDIRKTFLLQLLDGVQQSISTGNIYAMDFDLVNNVVYYGDRNASSIWKVSINRLTPLQDDRTLILSNATAWDISYDWMNGYIYWTDDVYQVIKRARVDDSNDNTIISTGDKVRGIAVDPLNEWLYWADDNDIFRSRLNGTDKHSIINISEPSSLTIDFVSNKLYWIDGQSVWMSTLDGSFKTVIFSHSSYKFFKMEVVKNQMLLTSVASSSYILVNTADLSFKSIEVPSNDIYSGVAIISRLKKPSKGWYSCFLEADECSHICKENENNSGEYRCQCPSGYTLLEDEVTCFNIETCPLCPNGVCYDFGGNISCQCPFTENRTLCDIELCGEVCNNRSTCENINGTYECQCKTGYTGKNCEEGICNFTCLNGGKCIGPNKCQCLDTYEGQDCSMRVCTPTYCQRGGTCIPDFGDITCRCPPFTTGPQCQFDDIVIIPALNLGTKVAVPISIIFFILIFSGVIGGSIYVYFKCLRPKRKIKFDDKKRESTYLRSQEGANESIHYIFEGSRAEKN